MKRIISIFHAVLLLTFFNLINAQSRWEYVNPYPTGFDLYSAARDQAGNIYLFGASGTVLKSDAGMKVWTTLNFNYFEDIYSACYSGNKLWAAGQKGLLCYSEDGGANWIKVNANTDLSFRKIVFTDESHGWILTGTNLLLMTADGGQNWQQVKFSSSLPLNDILFTDKNNGLLLSGFYQGAGQSGPPYTAGILYKTSDGGKSWVISDSGKTKYTAVSLAGSTLYMTTFRFGYGYSVLKSTDYGRNWDSTGSGKWDRISFTNASNGAGIWDYYLGTTADGGKNWTVKELSERPSALSRWTGIFSYGNTFIITGTEGNILVSTDNGNNFISHRKSLDLYYASLRGVVFNRRDRGYIFGRQFLENLVERPILLFTGNAGTDWNSMKSPDTSCISVLKIQNNVLYAGTEAGGLYRSENNAAVWSEIISSGEATEAVRDIQILNKDTLLYLSGKRIYKTFDGGKTWQKSPEFSVQFLDKIVFAGLHKWYLTGKASGSKPCFFTTDYGSEWFAAERKFTDLQFFTENTGYALDNAIYKTNDGGMSWSLVADPAAQKIENPLELFFVSEAAGWLRNGGYIYFTSDEGLNWKREYGIEAINSWYAPAFSAVSENEAWAVGENGHILHLNRKTSAAENERHSGFPSGYNLYQNYPNPFNPETTIRYSLAAGSHVSLKIFDMLGREVVTLVDGEKAAGKYDIKFNAASLSSGIYIYRIQAGSFTDMKKLMLLK